MTVVDDYVAAIAQPTLAQQVARFDELVAPDGTVRMSWRGLLPGLMHLEPADLRRARSDVDRLLENDGVTYNRPEADGSAGIADNRWRLDPIPLVIGAEEWSSLAVGIVQRTELLNAILVDLYGEQKLLSRGLLPPAIVFGHQGYLRSAARESAANTRPLLVAATDLGRDLNGDWQALADRAQAPSGIGYAIENRRIISRVLPEMYRDAGLHRLSPFFQTLRSALIDAAHEPDGEPRVVVLTPGTHSETAYDQAFVASRLGFPLVEGSDLTMRDGSIWMRSLGTYEKVDVILRRVDASYSDPLEMRADSQLGIPGLAEATRRGTVRVVNGLGSGVLENPGLLPFLPEISEALLGEPLRLPSTPTYWCGDPVARSHVLANLDSLVIRSIDGEGTTPGSLSAGAGGAELAARIQAEPHRFVGQEGIPSSQTPTLVGDTFEPRSVVLRTFAVRQGSTFRPLVGGLANIIDDPLRTISKDVWVLKERPDDPDQWSADELPFAGLRSSTALVPRVLEDLFWMGRYAERAEDTLRLLIATHGVTDDFQARPQSSGAAAQRRLMDSLLRLSRSTGKPLDPTQEFVSILLDEGRRGSVAQSLGSLAEGAQGVRDQLSLDIWMVFGDLERAGAALENNPDSHQVDATSNQMLRSLLALSGVTSNMVRDAGWHLLEVGSAIERALQLMSLLRSTVTTRHGIEIDRLVGSAVLAATESQVTYQRRYRTTAAAGNILDLLLADPDNPRSLEFQLQRIRSELAAMPGATGASRPERMIDDLLAELEQSDIPAMATAVDGSRPRLEEFLDTMIERISDFALAVPEHHFASSSIPRAYGPLIVVGT